MTLRSKLGFGILLIALTYFALTAFRNSRTEPSRPATLSSEVAPRSSEATGTAPTLPSNPSLPARLAGELKQRPEALLIASTPIPQIPALWMSRSVQQNQLLRTANDLVTALGECLPLNLCGQRTPTNKPYSPDDLTPAHQTLNRALEILRVARDQGESLALSSDALLNALRGANAAGQKIIIDLYTGRDLSENDFQRLADSRDSLKEDAIAYLFKSLQTFGTSGSRRQIFLAALRDSLNADSGASNYVLQNFDKLDLNEQEFRAAAEPLCRFKSDSRAQNNWTYARTQLEHYADAHGFSESAHTEMICR